MSSTAVGIVCLVVGVFAFAVGLIPPRQGMKQSLRLRSLIGGMVLIVLGVLLVTGVILN